MMISHKQGAECNLSELENGMNNTKEKNQQVNTEGTNLGKEEKVN